MTDLRTISIAREYVVSELVKQIRRNPSIRPKEIKEHMLNLLNEFTNLTEAERDRCKQEILIMLDTNYGKT